MNNIVVATSNLYLKVHSIYYVCNDYQTVPAKYSWSWKKFKFIETVPEKDIVNFKVRYSVYNEVTKQLENDKFQVTFHDPILAKKAYEKVVEQLQHQDPKLRYVDEALENALKGTQ